MFKYQVDILKVVLLGALWTNLRKFCFSELLVHKMKVKRKKKTQHLIKMKKYSSTQVRRNFLKPLTLTDLWKICVHFGQNRNRSLSRLATELPDKKWKKCTGQKCLIERNSEKKFYANWSTELRAVKLSKCTLAI